MLARFRIKPLIGWLVRIIGAALIIAATMAELLGLDRSGGWGPARRFLLWAGVMLVVASLAGLIRAILRRRGNRLGGEPVLVIKGEARPRTATVQIDLPARTTVAEDVKRRRLVTIIAASIFLACLVGFTWFISIGTWGEWPGSTEYFHHLADGFRAGQTHLLIEPDAKLLALSNPYDYENRKDIPQLWDATLFEGKYYLYWGPAPALIVVFLESIIGHPIGDQVLVWLFCLGTIFWIMLCLIKIFLRHYIDLPLWAFIVVGFSVLFANPFPWMLSRPAVYEAAIQAGQFFFMGGVFWFILQELTGRLSSRHMLLMGIFWTMAIASRTSLLTAVLPLSVVVLIRAAKTKRTAYDRGPPGRAILAFIIPLFVGGCTLAFYNYARFGSVLEFGHRYALSSWDMRDNYQGFIFSIKNLGPNLYNYFLNTFRTLDIFPFVKPRWGVYSIPSLRMDAGATYITEQVTGILISSPLTIVVAIPSIMWISKVWANLDIAKERRIPVNPLRDNDTLFLYIILLFSLTCILLPLLFFHANSMRYMMDFVPILMILSGVSAWSLIRKCVGRRSIMLAFLALLGLLSFYGSLIGSLLGITGPVARFEDLNPRLFDQITHFLSW
jgi:hypothetical protein